MVDGIISLADYLKDKKLFPLIRQPLNYLFIASICSYIFEMFYFEYEILDLLDYKIVLSFFLKGEFFIPFGIFLVILYLTYWVGYFAFEWTNMLISEKLKKKILDFSIEKNKYKMARSEVRVMTEIQKRRPEKINREWYQRLWKILRDELSAEEFTRLRKNLKEYQDSMTENFVLMFRVFVATSIYFLSIAYFGWLLYAIVLIVILICVLLFAIAYQFGELLPVAIDKFNYEMMKMEKDQPEEGKGATQSK